MSPINAEQLNQLLDPNCWPHFEHIDLLDDRVCLQARVPATLNYFAGHFPEQAVLPGVVQVHWVGELAQRLFGVSGFSDLKSIKFSNMILPETGIVIELKYSIEKGTVRFSYSTSIASNREPENFSSGMLSFGVTDRQA